jgi:hypothetical protein
VLTCTKNTQELKRLHPAQKNIEQNQVRYEESLVNRLISRANITDTAFCGSCRFGVIDLSEMLPQRVFGTSAEGRSFAPIVKG